MAKADGTTNNKLNQMDDYDIRKIDCNNNENGSETN